MQVFTREIDGIDGTKASLTGYVIDNSKEVDPLRVRPTVLVVPGGGYAMTSDREAEPIALQILSFGFNAFVLRYSCAPSRYPVALVQAAESVRLIRKNSQEWNVDPEHVAVLGFSAGGHVAASLATMWNKPVLTSLFESKEIRPDALGLGYAVLTSGKFAHRDSFTNLLGPQDQANEKLLREVSLEFQVDSQTPPTFLWHTMTDDLVPVENSTIFALALKDHGVPAEVHLYPQGGHGLSLGTAETAVPSGYGIEKGVQSWVHLFEQWLNRTFRTGER